MDDTLLEEDPFSAGRRRFLSGAAVALLAGVPSLARAGRKQDTATSDVSILNTAIAAELEAVAAYQLGADSGLLSSAVKAVAVTFQGHHREHADALAAAVRELGGTPEEPKARYDFPTSKLATEADVLTFAAGLERGAVSAYAGAIPLFADRALSGAAASILADEAMPGLPLDDRGPHGPASLRAHRAPGRDRAGLLVQ